MPHPLLVQFQELFALDLGLEAHLFNPPASEEQIQDFKDKIQLPLPELFYDFYRWHNGSRQDNYLPIGFHDGMHILSLERILSSKKVWDELEAQDTFVQYQPGTWWNSAWMPFMYIPDWYQMVIDTKGSYGGEAGQIFGYDFKAAEDRSVMYASFEKWLETMLELKKNNLLLYDAPEQAEEVDYNPEQHAKINRIIQQINGNFSFVAPIWKYRRTEQVQNPHFDTLREAIERNNLPEVKKLLAAQKVALDENNPYEVDNYTPLHVAIASKKFKIAAFLIEQGADVQKKDAYGLNAFTKIVSSYSYLNDPQDTTQVLDLLLERGHSFETKPNHWYDPLFQLLRTAVSINELHLLNYCLEQGVDPNKPIPYSDGNRLLHQAIRDGKAQASTLAALIEGGADPKLPNEAGQTPLMIFQEKYKKSGQEKATAEQQAIKALLT